MVRDIIKYPTPLSVQYATDVRSFNEELFSLIDDLKDTITENNLDGLAAFQIGSYYNVIVVKNEEGKLLEMINPRIISYKGRTTVKEQTAYYPNITEEIPRYERISVIYQDRDAKDKSLQVEGIFAATIQRKIDYTHGATFIQKMAPDAREKFEKKLEFGADVGNDDYCPTSFKRDYISKGVNILLALMLLPLLVSFFSSDTALLNTLWNTQLFAAGVVGILIVIYFFYAQIEAKRYSSCSSCQIGNIVGTCAVALVKLFAIILLSYFFINPS